MTFEAHTVAALREQTLLMNITRRDTLATAAVAGALPIPDAHGSNVYAQLTKARVQVPIPKTAADVRGPFPVTR